MLQLGDLQCYNRCNVYTEFQEHWSLGCQTWTLGFRTYLDSSSLSWRQRTVMHTANTVFIVHGSYLDRNAMSTCRWVPMFRRYILPPSSGWRPHASLKCWNPATSWQCHNPDNHHLHHHENHKSLPQLFFVKYWSMLFQLHILYSIKWDGKMIMKHEQVRLMSWPISSYYPGSCLERQENNQNSQ
jgi:hypothetical protein